MGQGGSRDTGPRRRAHFSTSRPLSALLSDAQPILSQAVQPTSNPLTTISSHPDMRPSDTTSVVGSLHVRRPSRLSRARAALPNILTRYSPSQERSSLSLPPSSAHQAALGSSSRNASNPFLPHIQLPDLDLNFDTPLTGLSTHPRTTAQRQRPRSVTSMSDRISSLRPDMGLRNISASLRRRRSPLPHAGDEQAAMLSRLLSVAAAATAASLMGNNPRTAITDMQNSGGSVAQGEDGTFDGFLQALRNGELASALRQNSPNGNLDSDVSDEGTIPLNFFRMFRFGSSSTDNQESMAPSRPSTSGLSDQGGRESPSGHEADGRMVPILIVGIRSINPESRTGEPNENPFLDALSNLQAPTPPELGNHANAILDGFMRPDLRRNRLGQRRRASMNGFNMFSGANENQRLRRPEGLAHSRSETLASMSSDSLPGPYPPPSTPSDLVSAIASGANTPERQPSNSSAGRRRSASSPPRRDGLARRVTGSPLEVTAEEPSSPSRTTWQNRSNETDYTPRFGSGNPRRNGMVEPDSATAEGSRSWIIYVLGGSYPENHPILTTPSLFTDSPTYEDMLLLSSLLGPAKPTVATSDDVEAAGGLFKIENSMGRLVAMSANGPDIVNILPGERCLVCLCNYEANDEARRLVKCSHLFHRECIDQWLTTGRNSCPLCRGQGVDEATSEPSGEAAERIAEASSSA